jgi:hypothetical protein
LLGAAGAHGERWKEKSSRAGRRTGRRRGSGRREEGTREEGGVGVGRGIVVEGGVSLRRPRCVAGVASDLVYKKRFTKSC